MTTGWHVPEDGSLNALGISPVGERGMDVLYPDEDRQTSIQGVNFRAFPSGHLLFKAGSPRQHAYLVERGEVVLSDETGQEICRCGAGDVFGEMALIDDGKRTTTAITDGEAEIFIIPREVFYGRMGGLDPVLSFLIGVLIDRYRAACAAMPQFLGVQPIVNKGAGYRAALEELTLEKQIRLGLERAEFVPVLQPVIDLTDYSIVGFEALIRWYHGEKGLIFPDQFIPAAERAGIVPLLDRMMLRKTCRMIPRFLADYPDMSDDFFISVNLSGVNFETPDIINVVRDALIDNDVSPHNLKLEITETALISDPDKAKHILDGLRALGVAIALDDFGTGYSSLLYLHRFPLDYLKIDRSFVTNLQETPNTVNLVSAIIGLARHFNLGVIVEGVENGEDAAILKALGCDMAQGYLFGKPMSSDDAMDYIARNLARV